MKNQTRGESPLSETACCASLFVRLSGINLVLVILGAAIIPMGAALTALTDPATYPQLHFLGLVMCWLGGGGVMLCAIAANRTADLIRHNVLGYPAAGVKPENKFEASPPPTSRHSSRLTLVTTEREIEETITRTRLT